MGDCLVSVIIPVYNTEQYIVECIDSIINQTYSNIEIIIINDGSTDNSLEILKEFDSNYSNIKLISQENMGNSVARNRGIEESKGEYIYFLDSDDYILPNTFSNLIELMENHELDLIRFAAESFLDGIDKKINKKQYDFQKYFKKGKVYGNKEFLSINIKAFSSSPCLYIMRRGLLIKNKLRFQPGIMHEDELFTLELFLNTKSVMYDSNFYYKRRYRKDSIMTSESNDKNKFSFDSYFIVAKHLNELLMKYKNPTESKLIKCRIRPVYYILLNKKIDEIYKKESLIKVEGISEFYKFYYFLKYKIKRIIK